MMGPALELVLVLGLILFKAEAGMKIVGYQGSKERCRMRFFNDVFDWVGVIFFWSLWVNVETEHYTTVSLQLQYPFGVYWKIDGSLWFFSGWGLVLMPVGSSVVFRVE